MMPGMFPETDQAEYRIIDFLLAILSVPFAAYCVWLTVRIVNRRERWAIKVAIFLGIACLLVVGYLLLPRVQQ